MQDYAIRIYEPDHGQCYVEFLFATLSEEGYARFPGIEVAKATFKTLGHQPEEMIRAFGRFLQDNMLHLTPEQTLRPLNAL
ncbi:hypothetical protein AGMMS50289_18570 [Betaproteobacteria bacterium]|nr:hypothetical protein AGMMS50289_18570 [Betaproteobacteria bacterium]